MPTYEYRCAKCKKMFSLSLRFSEYGRKKVKCPSCHSAEVERVPSTVSVKTSRKS